MITIWFNLNKFYVNDFLHILNFIVSPEDIIIRIKKSVEGTYIKFICEGELLNSEELFKTNWNHNKYLVKLTYDIDNKKYDIEIPFSNKEYQKEIDLVNKELQDKTNIFKKLVWGDK